jgi:autotransporter-associated beta strand protein
MANDGNGNTSWFTGAIDDLRLYTKALSAAEVQALYLGGGLLPAAGPHPVNGENNVVYSPTLTWQPGGTTNFLFNIFLGTNAVNVAAATTNSAEFQGQVAAASFLVTNTLATNATYYWRVDELYGVSNLVVGTVWSFNTAPDSIHGGLKLYLSFDARDTSSTTTYDRAGLPYHDGTLYGSPTQTNGQVYEGLSFNGSSTYVQTPALNMATSNATFLAWLNLNGNQNAYDGIIMCHGGTTWSGMMIASTPNRLGYQWNDDSSTWTYNSGPILPTNQWVLAAISVTNNRAVFYVGQTNGTMAITTNNYTHIFQAFDAPVDVGQDPFGGRWFNGLVDEVCIWNRALSAAEIGQILTNGINGTSFAGARPAASTNTFTWIGNSDVYWTNSLNWATNGVPGAANTVYFNDAAGGNTATQIGTNLAVAGVNLSGAIRTVGIFGTNTLTLGAGGIVITNAVTSLTMGTAVSLGAPQTWSVASSATVTLTNKLSGSSPLTLTGGGTNYFNNNTSGSSYGGAIIVNAGTLSLPYGWNTPSVTGNVTIGTNGTLIFNSHPYSYGTDNYTTNAGTLIVNGDNHLSNLELRGGQIAGTGYLRCGDIWGYSSGGKWASRSNSVTATINVASLSLYNVNTTFTVENGTAEPDLLISSPIKDGANGAASLTKTGLGSLMLTQPNLYSGNTTNAAGTLNLSGVDNILPVGTTLFLATNTTLNLNGINQSVASLIGYGAVNLGSGSLTDNEAGTNLFGGIISGNPGGLATDDTQTAPLGGIALVGAGKLILTNAQVYTGDTWVSAGTLVLSNNASLAASSNLVVASGAKLDASARTDGTLKLISGQTLSGFGTVAGKVIVTNGAVIAPGGVAIGTLTLNSTLNLTGGQVVMKISKLGVALANDYLTGITTLTCGGSLNVTNLGPAAPAAGDSFKLFNATTYTGTFTNFNLPVLASNLAWNTSQLAVSGTLSVIALTPPVLAGAVTAGNGRVQLTFSGNSGQTYKVVASTNLLVPLASWPVLTNGTFGGTAVNFSDTVTNNAARFYRVVSP